MNEVDNRVPFGVRNEDFEKVGAGSTERYSGEDGLVAGVARAARLVIMARERNVFAEQRERAEAILCERVGQLFGEFTVDAKAIADFTGLGLVENDQKLSYNSLHISVRNPDYVAPIATTQVLPSGATMTTWDWSRAHGSEFIDVAPSDVIANPTLGLELVVHNDFHL